jgi:moderate conductance mechanosensitive channel
LRRGRLESRDRRDVIGVSFRTLWEPPGSALAARARLRAVGGALVLLGLIAGIGPAAAQALPGLPGAASEQAPQAQSTGPEEESDRLRAELETLLQRLEDPEATRELADSLRALLHAMDAESGADEPDAATAGESEVREALTRAKPAAAELLARIEQDLRARVDTVRDAGAQVYQATKMLPGFLAWAERLVDAPAERQAFARAAGGIAAILAAGLLAMWLAGRALAPARRALVFRDQDRLLSRWIMAIFLILLRIVPILAFAVVVNILILIVRPEPVIQVWLSAGVSAIVVVRLGAVLAQAVLSPAAAQARLVPLSDEAARLLMTYVHWLLALGVFGYTLISVLRWHGLPTVLQITLDRLVALALLLSACWMVIRRRRAVAAAIARLADDVDASSIPWRGVASVWHVFALIFLWALFVIYIMEGLPLFIEVLMTSILSLSVLIGLVMALRYLEGRTDALQPSLPDDDLDEELGDPDTKPTAQASSPRRAGPLVIVLRIAIVLVAILTFLQVWGLDTWLLVTQSGPGQRLILILVVVGLIYLLWLGFNRLIAGYMRRLEEQPGTARSSTRTRTALVLARNAAFVTLCVIGGMVILSEIGLNIGPLLAGAGVIGIAIGFGAQHLVQDIITGLFNLIEDTFAVGDVVDLGGKSGVVEAVTIRTVRLRDVGGNVHTIPFSAIAVVTNMSKDFSFAVFDIGIAYHESVDDVMRVITEVAEDLRRDRAYRRVIWGPLEMLGVDRLADSAVVIKCRLKVRPALQWAIAREFNRRLKNRFDELGIEFPFPQQTIHFGRDRGHAAPPAELVLDAPEHEEHGRDPAPAKRQAGPRLAE